MASFAFRLPPPFSFSDAHSAHPASHYMGSTKSWCKQRSQLYNTLFTWKPLCVIASCEHSNCRKREQNKMTAGVTEVVRLQGDRLIGKKTAGGDVSCLIFYISTSVAARGEPVSCCCYCSTSVLHTQCAGWIQKIKIQSLFIYIEHFIKVLFCVIDNKGTSCSNGTNKNEGQWWNTRHYQSMCKNVKQKSDVWFSKSVNGGGMWLREACSKALGAITQRRNLP